MWIIEVPKTYSLLKGYKFIFLIITLVNNIFQVSSLRIIHPVTNQELCFTWSPKPSYGLNDCSVGINATFANSLNLHENDCVVISSEERIVQLTQVFLVPFSSDDYEILVC